MDKSGIAVVLVIVAAVATSGYFAGRATVSDLRAQAQKEKSELEGRIATLEGRIAKLQTVTAALVTSQQRLAASGATAARPAAAPLTGLTTTRPAAKSTPRLPNLNNVKAGGNKIAPSATSTP